MLGQLTHATVYVRDQNAARDFYTNKLGFDIVADESFEMGGHAMSWLTVRPKDGGPQIALWPGSEQQGTLERIGKASGLVFHCADVDATYDELSAKGVEFSMPPGDVPWGRHAMLKDQDGNELYLVQPAL